MSTRHRETLARAGRAVAFVLLGALACAGVTVGLLAATTGAQSVVYRALSWTTGPSEATAAAAVLAHVLGVGLLGATAAALLGDGVDARLAGARTVVAGGVAATAAAVVVVALAALAGVASLPVVGAFALVALGAWVAASRRRGVSGGGTLALGGAAPVVLGVLLVAGVGLGWGWGYVVTAEPVAGAPANATVADFDAAPGVAADLFADGNCEADGTCRLELRGYEREVAAARFLARHGAACPYRGVSNPAFARYGNRTYRVTCGPHGD
ncbi:MAG: hypothetical protein ABEJ80_02555 [Halarchaeum sp.]